MTEIDDLVERIIASGCQLRLTLACDGHENLSSDLKTMLRQQKDVIVEVLVLRSVAALLLQRSGVNCLEN